MRRRASMKDVLHRRRWQRWIVLAVVVALPVSVLCLWIAVHRVSWLGPLVADSLRALIGKDAVTELENIAYGVQDRVYQYARRGERPKAYWTVPPQPSTQASVEPPAPAPSSTTESQASVPPRPPPFRPADVGPVHKSWSAPGDGLWLPIELPDHPQLDPHLYKTLLHPDKNRSWAELFVVAMDIGRIDLHLVPGSREPAATEPGAEELVRPGKIPPSLHSTVLAAFNGGFKTVHGSYGMFTDGVTLVAPKSGVCAVALFEDRHIEVDAWDILADRREQMVWWRQTPNCMIQDGKLHPKLVAGYSKKWGATLDGNTVIRRSAIGVTRDGQTLLVGISNHTTAVAIAEGMRHAGAKNVAQLDVNFSYPKFVVFASGGKPLRKAVALVDGFEYSPDEYLRKTALRDFFFVTPVALRR